jgi:peptide/nickel transport system ATP-binding protein
MAKASWLLEANGLKKYFPITKGIFSRPAGYVKAVDGVSFRIRPGETLGLVGESGCGKSTTGRMVLHLIRPTEGTVLYKGQDLGQMGAQQMREIRKRMQMIFQDPFSSLNPRMTVTEIIGEPLAIHRLASGRQKKERIAELLELVGLSKRDMGKYPHQFSGGQRQRIGIARALATNPELVVCDEAVSALDVSVQAQVLNLLKELQERLHLSYLFISHDLNVVKYISDRICVMYLGEIVEEADSEALFGKPLHPYTQALFSAVPNPDPMARKERILLKGEAPSAADLPSGCKFHPRCPKAMERCKTEAPALREVASGHQVACHLY